MAMPRETTEGTSQYRKSDRRSPTLYRPRVELQHEDGICEGRDCPKCGTGPQEADKDRKTMDEYRY